jgi:hypothetical protein
MLGVQVETKDWVRSVGLALVVLLMSGSYGVVVVASQLTSGGTLTMANIDLTMWSPATLLSVASVIFSFGMAWQSLRVQGKTIQDLCRWRDTIIDPTVGQHGRQLAALEARCDITHGEPPKHR